jgi:hypothetical protein
MQRSRLESLITYEHPANNVFAENSEEHFCELLNVSVNGFTIALS